MQLSEITDLITSFGAFLSPLAAIVGVVYARQAKGEAKEAKGHAKEAEKQSTQANEGEPIADRGNGSSPRIYEMMLDNAHAVRALQNELAAHVESEATTLANVQDTMNEHVEWEVNRYLNHQHLAETLHAPLELEPKEETN